MANINHWPPFSDLQYAIAPFNSSLILFWHLNYTFRKTMRKLHAPEVRGIIWRAY